jgi:hypothetical protein
MSRKIISHGGETFSPSNRLLRVASAKDAAGLSDLTQHHLTECAEAGIFHQSQTALAHVDNSQLVMWIAPPRFSTSIVLRCCFT